MCSKNITTEGFSYKPSIIAIRSTMVKGWIGSKMHCFLQRAVKRMMLYIFLWKSHKRNSLYVNTVRLLIKGIYLDMDFVTSCSDSDMLCLRFLLWVCAFEALSLTFVLVLLFSDGVMLPWLKEGCLERKGKPETTCIEWRLLGLGCSSLDLWDWSVAGSSEYCAELWETPEAAILFCLFFLL